MVKNSSIWNVFSDFSVHDVPNFVVDYDYSADMIINCRVGSSQLHQQKLFENWMKKSPKMSNYSLVCLSIYLNNLHIFV
jgi:hypothetical protein